MAATAEVQLSRSLDTYMLVDDIPEVAAARQSERLEAWTILEGRRDNQWQGTGEMAPPVDALSTAHSVLEMSRNYGQTSPQCQERYEGLVLDCQRLVAEWYRKKKSEYFPPVRHYFNEESQEFFSHGLSIRQMTHNALLPIAGNREEEQRRVNEKVEDATPQLLRQLGGLALGGVAIRTISECTDKAISDYAQDIAAEAEHRGYGGYVPEIEKVMIRDIRFDEASNDRFEEQVGLPGLYINHFVIQEALARSGVEVANMDKTELHGAQIVAPDGLMDFVETLDRVASEQWCTNIFMGEVVPAGYEKDYVNFRQEALARQAGLKSQSDIVASLVLDLAHDNVDRQMALTMVEDFVKKLLLDLAKQDTEVAEQMFDDNTARGLQEVVALEQAGRYDEAFEKMQVVERAAPGGGYCGAGSCGLESVNTASVEGRAIANALGAGLGDKIVQDKVRTCKCGQKSIFYAYNAKRVSKYCSNCNASETKIT